MLFLGEAYKIKVHFYSHHAGFYEQLLVFKFETCPQSDTFEIMRLLEVARRTSFNEEVLPTAANSSCDLQTLRWTPAEGYDKWISCNDNVIYVSVLIMLYSITYEIQPLNWNNYSQRFHLLLHLEEFQQKTDIEKYNQDDVPLFRHKSNTNLFVLQITGVSKGSLLKLSGNQVLVTPLNQKGVENEIHQVHNTTLMTTCEFECRFISDFKDGMRFRVLFAINRVPLRIQHRAVARVYKHGLREVLFPTGKLSSHHSHIHRSAYLKSNPEQHMAIQHILAGSAKPSPYLVFGPPGTGKTATLVEAINQIVKTQASCNILACAPSNSATDHLCEKILEGNLGNWLEVYRLYSLSTPVKNIPQNSKLCCNLIYGTNTFMIPPKEELMNYKILVTTLQTAGRLVTGGIPPGHFTYIFVDEAGQAAETECIIPIAGLLKPHRCQVVLAGDPKQLGPIITSKIAQEHGMGVSLLERLMGDIDLYKSHETYGFNNRFVTKLLRNYRSHPAILKIPNELFYKGELQPFARKEKCNSFCKWERLPKKGFPLIFHGVAGSDERDANSPSVYNMAEVEVLKEYLKVLVDHICKKTGTKIQPREIGIIAPYRKQVEKIQKALEMDKDLKKENLENILVGSVEQFQGKEFNVILMSTVRSTPKLTAHKQRFTIGFLDNEKRFNVALTRAQALLIVVGDPRLTPTCLILSPLFLDSSITAIQKGVIEELQSLMQRRKMHRQTHTYRTAGNVHIHINSLILKYFAH
uniref:RNA helicase n=1 Tax=Dicentrarchus labrax TaxID=13489 RepID=A0A8C4GF93_DICLA